MQRIHTNIAKICESYILDIAHWHFAIHTTISNNSCGKGRMRFVHTVKIIYVDVYSFHASGEILAERYLRALCRCLPFDIWLTYIKTSFNAEVHFILYVRSAYTVYPNCPVLRPPFANLSLLIRRIEEWITRCVLQTSSC